MECKLIDGGIYNFGFTPETEIYCIIIKQNDELVVLIDLDEKSYLYGNSNEEFNEELNMLWDWEIQDFDFDVYKKESMNDMIQGYVGQIDDKMLDKLKLLLENRRPYWQDWYK